MPSVMQDLIDINNLSYLSDTDASVAVQRQQTELIPPKTKYSGGSKIIFKLPKFGINFQDFQNSSFVFKMVNTGGTALTFSLDGSALNAINRVLVTSNGETISDSENVNLYEMHNSKITESESYLRFAGPAYGYNHLVQETLVAGTEYNYAIPMRKLAPFFDTDQFVHPRITNGMTITIFLESDQVAYSSTAVSTYEISNPKLVLDTTQVSDGIYNELRKMGTKGHDALVYEYYDVTHEYANITGNTSVLEYPLTMSVTNAVQAVALLRVVTEIDDITISSLHTKGPKMDPNAVNTSDNMQWKSGSTSLPNVGAKNGLEIYNTLLCSLSMLADKESNRFTLARSEFTAEFGCYLVDLRRSRMFKNSGREISNNQTMSVHLEQF